MSKFEFNPLSGQFDLVSDLSGYVPYTGATSDVDLGVYGLTGKNTLLEHHQPRTPLPNDPNESPTPNARARILRKATPKTKRKHNNGPTKRRPARQHRRRLP